MKDESENKVIEAFQKIDESIEISAPNINTISLLLKEKHQAHKRNVKRELSLFLVIAVVLTALLLLLLTNAPVIYVAIQFAVVVLVPLYVAMQARKRNREDTYI